jgi:seryl-tRNA synthetase
MIQDFGRPGTVTAGGRLAMTGIAASLRSWFDARIRTMALADGAHECHFPSSIARETLDRAGYFDSFPDGAAAIGTGPRTDFFLTPAVCFHAYALLADRAIEEPLTLTACQTCFREADRRAGDPAITRLWEYLSEPRSGSRRACGTGPGAPPRWRASSS